MKPLALDEIRVAVHGMWLSQRRGMTIHGVNTDTRTARAGELFVALKGDRFDGHDFLDQAGRAGCVAAIVRRNVEIDAATTQRFSGGLIGVGDTMTALGELAAYYRRTSATAVVAVTGSNGKTTTKWMIHHILSRRLRGSCSPKSFNNAVGVPLTLLAVEPGDDYVVCELGSSARGEMAALTAIARPNVAVILSVAPTHLERLGTVEDVAVEKASILSGLAEDGLAIVSADSKPLGRALRAYSRRTIRFGQSDSAELRVTGYAPQGLSQRFEVNGREWVSLALPGRHNALNALAAMAVAQRFGFDRRAAGEALSDFRGPEMRLELIQFARLRLINDAYNANPASVAAAVDVLAALPADRRVLVLGDMRELGPQAERLHLSLGRQLAGETFDLVVGVGALGRYIATGAAEVGMETAVFDSTSAACSGLAEFLQDDDLVLIKGSRAMRMERLIEPIRTAFDCRRAGPDNKKAGRSQR